jgi:hypothetical protein
MFPVHERYGVTTYTTQLQAGLGLVEETRLLLALYSEGMSTNALFESALQSGSFPNVSARRLRNIVAECFAPRYIKSGVASYLKALVPKLPAHETNQLLLAFTAGANEILQAFIEEVYWDRYSGGHNFLTSEDAKSFVEQAVRDGKTQSFWSESTMRRVASYLLGCCADYGLLSQGRTARREIQPIRLQQSVVVFLAYHLHFSGMGDNAVINHEVWRLYGLSSVEVRGEFKQIAKNGWLIAQSAGDVTRISWSLGSMEEVIGVIA